VSGSTSYLIAKRNLVVEGVDDYWILTELSNLLKRSGKSGLSDDVLITPAGGASEAAYITTFMIGQNLGVVVLLDSDAAGESAPSGVVHKYRRLFVLGMTRRFETLCGSNPCSFGLGFHPHEGWVPYGPLNLLRESCAGHPFR
jgi:hypothetical protein